MKAIVPLQLWAGLLVLALGSWVLLGWGCISQAGYSCGPITLRW